MQESDHNHIKITACVEKETPMNA